MDHEAPQPCLAMFIFNHMKRVVVSTKNPALLFPCLIYTLLRNKGLTEPTDFERPIYPTNFNSTLWDFSLRQMFEARFQAFLISGWKPTIGLIVNGEEMTDDHPDMRIRSLVPRGMISFGDSTYSDDVDEDNSSNVSNQIAELGVQINARLDSIDKKFQDIEEWRC